MSMTDKRNRPLSLPEVNDRKMSRREMVKLCAFVTAATQVASAQHTDSKRTKHPNFVVILADDMGFGDLGLYGNPVIKTPNINQMAREGTELTSFCSSPLCSPSRGMLLTGKYPPRTGLINVTGPGSPVGLRDSDVTIAQSLKNVGYRTAMFGKWHIGDFDTNPTFNPTKHGFDRFVGLPYSHDYNPAAGVPLYRNMEKIEQPVKYNLLTKRYTEEATTFIKESKKTPFFIYVAHNMPHIPIGTSDEFKGHSRAGRYGDVIEEIDWSVGEILRTVKEAGKEKETLVVILSDNGPWVQMGEMAYDRAERGKKVVGEVGWAGLLRGSKGTTYEGGVRVPCVFHWPGQIPAGRVSAEMVSVMDLYGTLVPLAGGQIPRDRPFDGIDVSAFLMGSETPPRKEMFYYSSATLQAVRVGSWKLRIGPEDPLQQHQAAGTTPNAVNGDAQRAKDVLPEEHRPTQSSAGPVTQLFNLDTDPSERYNVARARPDLVERLKSRMQTFDQEVKSRMEPLVAYRERVSPLD